MFLPAALVLASLLPAGPHSRCGLADSLAQKFEIENGDRIVWIGSTLVEREQRYGYWETALHAAFPDKQFTLRNLGWSGDTVFGDARGRFDFNNPNFCFKQLVDLTLELKPTVIFVSYGTNESFEGEAGLPKFEKGLEKLLDALKPAKARVVLFTPLPVEKAPGLSDPTARNATIALYRDVIKGVAKARNHSFIDLFERIRQTKFVPDALPLTENGMHLSLWGYKVTALFLLSDKPELGLWVDSVDGFEQLIQLRKAIVAKNQLFFYRWRPQNETYLFGFRKHEQGKNGKEVAEFDPLVAKAEAEIEALRKKLK